LVQAGDIKIPSIENIASIEEIVKPYIDHKATKGLSIAVYNRGKVDYYNYGICSDENPVPPSNQSVYEIGSISKTFTVSVLVQMIKEGKVDKTKIGLAWGIISLKKSNLELLAHNGETGGYTSIMLFPREEQIGVVVLANCVKSVDIIGVRILQLLEKQKSATQETKTKSH